MQALLLFGHIIVKVNSYYMHAPRYTVSKGQVSKTTTLVWQPQFPMLGIVMYLRIGDALYAQKSVLSWFLAVFDSKIDEY